MGPSVFDERPFLVGRCPRASGSFLPFSPGTGLLIG
jgi:hypothetical protein